jgi:hypothetical protein
MSLGPGVPDPPAAPRLVSHQSSRHRLGERVMVHAKSILGGLHHDYSLVAVDARSSFCGSQATEGDIQAIRNAMDARPKVSLSPFALATAQDYARQIVLRPLASPDSASSSASSPEGKKLSVEKAQKKVAERVGLLAAGDGRSSSASLRTAAAGPRRPKIAPRFLSNPVGASTHPAPPNKKGLKDRPFLFGGEGGIRTITSYSQRSITYWFL